MAVIGKSPVVIHKYQGRTFKLEWFMKTKIPMLTVSTGPAPKDSECMVCGSLAEVRVKMMMWGMVDEVADMLITRFGECPY